MMLTRLLIARRCNSSLLKVVINSSSESPILLYMKEVRKLASEKKRKITKLVNKVQATGTVAETPNNYEGVYTKFGWFAIPCGYYDPEVTIPELERLMKDKLIEMGHKSLISEKASIYSAPYSALLEPLPPQIIQELQHSVVSKWSDSFDPTGIVRESNVDRKERRARELKEKEYKRQLSTGSRGLRKIMVDGVVAAAIEKSKKEEHTLIEELFIKHNISMDEFNQSNNSDFSTNLITFSEEDAAESINIVSLTESKALYRLAHIKDVDPELSSAERTRHLNLKWKLLNQEIKNYYRGVYGRIRAGGYDVYRGKIVLGQSIKTGKSTNASKK